MSSHLIDAGRERQGILVKNSRARNVLRSLVLRGLSNIEGGRLRICDERGEIIVGEQGDVIATINVIDPRFYSSVALGGGMGAADSYINGWWSSDNLVAMLRLMTRNIGQTDRLGWMTDLLRRPFELLGNALRRNSIRGSLRNIHAHYDLGNDFFGIFLDPTMCYSSGIFSNPDSSLEDASIAKLDRLIDKMNLRESDRLLEIGTGWGAMAVRAAERSGCEVLTTTISREQAAGARERVSASKQSQRITIVEQDYRSLTGTHDRIVAVEMIEAVGHRYLPDFFANCERLLASDGLLALQLIAMPDHRYARYLRTTDFIREVIFPGSCCPSMGAIVNAARSASHLDVIHLEDMSGHYAETLRRWRLAFMSNLDTVRSQGFDDRFIRMWEYYLAYCEAGFAERYVHSFQAIMGRSGGVDVGSVSPLPRSPYGGGAS